MNFVQRILHRPFFIRLFNWEYWSFSTVYFCIYPFWLYLALRARSFFFFAAANPRIKNGGFLNESKEQIASLIPEQYHPRSVFFSLPANADIVLQTLADKHFSYPLIGKPNMGGRGRGIKMLAHDDDVRVFVKNACLDFHIQEYVSFKNEVGIFYCRYPNGSNGKITGIVRKEFLSVTGDGKSSMRELLEKNRRAIMYLRGLERMHGANLDIVLPRDEKRILSPFGNHARGSLFIDDSNLVDDELTRTIDRICRQIPEFYFGRLDIRFNSWEELKQGKKLAIIEVNGAGAEPTHIYDPRHSIFFAWKEIIRHWLLLCTISRMNHKRGYPYLTVKEGLRMFEENKLVNEKLAAMAV